MAWGWRLLLENVEAGAGELAGYQRLMQRRLHDDPAARGVDQVGRGFHVLQPRRIEQANRLRGLRAMNTDEIGPRQRCIEVDDRGATRRLDISGRLVGI